MFYVRNLVLICGSKKGKAWKRCLSTFDLIHGVWWARKCVKIHNHCFFSQITPCTPTLAHLRIISNFQLLSNRPLPRPVPNQRWPSTIAVSGCGEVEGITRKGVAWCDSSRRSSQRSKSVRLWVVRFWSSFVGVQKWRWFCKCERAGAQVWVSFWVLELVVDTFGLVFRRQFKQINLKLLSILL